MSPKSLTALNYKNKLNSLMSKIWNPSNPNKSVAIKNHPEIIQKYLQIANHQTTWSCSTSKTSPFGSQSPLVGSWSILINTWSLVNLDLQSWLTSLEQSWHEQSWQSWSPSKHSWASCPNTPDSCLVWMTNKSYQMVDQATDFLFWSQFQIKQCQ